MRAPTRALVAMTLLNAALAQPAAPVDKGSLSGTVMNAAGIVLRRTTVSLAAIPPGQGGAQTETDQRGNFTFSDIAPGRYAILAERSGYLPARYIDSRGAIVTVGGGQQITGLAIKMIEQALVAGRVLDEDNEPVVNTTVTLARYPTLTGAQRGRASPPTHRGTTNADGAFAIGDVEPGKYILSAAAPSVAHFPIRGDPQPHHREVYVTTYYPDAIDSGSATPIQVSAGSQLRGIEIRSQKVAVFNVSGKITDAADRDAGSVQVLNLIRRGSGPPGLRTQTTGVNSGSFAFTNVLPGDYILEAAPMEKTEKGPPLVGRQMVSVGNADLDRVVLEMKPGTVLQGKITLEGADISWPKISLSPVEGLNIPDLPAIDLMGRFVLEGLTPGSYHVNVATSGHTYLKVLRFNGQEISDQAIDVAAPTGTLEVIVSDKTSTLTGIVKGENGPAGFGVAVFAVPRQARQLSRPVPTDENGRFAIKELAPGDYLLIAMDIGGGVDLPPEIAERLGQPVSVAEGSTVSVEVPMTSIDKLRIQ